MSQDRRRYPRYPALIHCAIVFARERREMFCTQVGPAAGFVAGRADGLVPGQIVSVDMRPGGLAAASVLLQGEVVRVVPAGGSWPAGLVVRWKTISCELGVAPLLDFVSKVLHVSNVAHTDVAAGRQAEFDLEAVVAGRPARVRSAARSSDVYSTDLRQPAASAAGRAAARGSQLVPSAGLLSALSSAKPAVSPRNIGGTISRGAQPMVRDDDTATLEPIMVREVSQVFDNRRRGATNPRMPNILPVHHAGGPVLEGVDRATAIAIADELPPGSPHHSAHSDSHRVAAVAGTAAYGVAAGEVAAAQAGTPSRLALPPGAPPFAALGPNLLSPLHSKRQSGSGDPELVLPTPQLPAGGGSSPTPSETSSAFDWPASKLPVPPAPLPGYQRAVEPESIAVHKPVVPPQLVAKRMALSDGHHPNEMSHVAGPALLPPADMPDDGLSRSWPVYALAPGERRTDPEDGPDVPDLAGLGADIDMSGEPTEANPKAQVTDNLGNRPVERPNMAVMRRRGPSRSETRHMVAATIPVSYDHGGRQGRGMVIAISPEAAAVVTTDIAPQLDEPVVLHLPLADKTGPIIVHLCGKLLQITTETEQGPRFVLHIERVEEGQSKGAFMRALDQLAQA